MLVGYKIHFATLLFPGFKIYKNMEHKDKFIEIFTRICRQILIAYFIFKDIWKILISSNRILFKYLLRLGTTTFLIQPCGWKPIKNKQTKDKFRKLKIRQLKTVIINK